jgi:hypothetical protein
MPDMQEQRREEHRAWSAAERRRLSKDRKALGEAIKTRAIENLTKADRDVLIDAYGKPAPQAKARQPAPRATRVPEAFAPAQLPTSPRQDWRHGELAYAIKRAAAYWAALLIGGALLLEFLWYWVH